MDTVKGFNQKFAWIRICRFDNDQCYAGVQKQIFLKQTQKLDIVKRYSKMIINIKFGVHFCHKKSYLTSYAFRSN